MILILMQNLNQDYIRFVVKDQTSKYDIVAPTEKVAVADPDNVTKKT